jgi:hypothetical protein
MHHLLAGVGRCDITPAPGTPQGGWGAQTHQRGLGADLPLYATALVLADSAQSIAIIDVDAIGFDAEWTGKIIDAVAELSKIPREHIRFSCTHTHSGPNTFRMALITEGLDMATAYLHSLPQRIASAVWQAQQNLKPVRVAAAEGTCEIGVNRRLRLENGQVVIGRNWAGPVDHTVRIVRIDDLAENPLATIVHFACHPTTIAWQSHHATPDYPGMAKKVVEEQLGGTCLFLQGATGNLHPRRGFTGDFSVYRKMGKMLGLEATKLALGVETLPRKERLTGVQESGARIGIYEDEAVEPPPAALAIRTRMLSLPAAQLPPPEALEGEAATLRAEVARLRQHGTEEEIRATTAHATQVGMRADRARMFHGKSHIDWPLMVIRIGEVALVSMQGEPFIEIAQEIAAASPFPHTLVSGYSNGGFGYMPVASAFAEGGYEVEVSPFAPEAAEIMVGEAVKLLHELR